MLVQFLEMTEDRVDTDVAMSLLEAVGWNLQAAMEQLYGGPVSPGSRPGTAAPPPMHAPAEPAGRAQEWMGMQHHEAEEDMVRRALADSQGESLGDELGRPGSPETVMDVRDPPSQELGDGTLDADAELARAIEASYCTQTDAGRMASEDEMLMEAMRISQVQEESRQRQSLREQQDAELLESMMMDNMRKEQEQKLRAEEEELQRVAEQARCEEELKQREQEQQAARELEMKRSRLPAEPPAGEPGRLLLMLRLPKGQRLQRAFRSSETVGTIYDFVDIQQLEELAGEQYRLVSTMPRKAYEDRQVTLADAGIQNQFVLMVELV